MLITSHKQKQVEPVGDFGVDCVNNGEGSASQKRKKGAVKGNSRRENEEMIRDLFTDI